MHRFLTSLVLAVTSSLVWTGIILILDESKLRPLIVRDITGVWIGGLIIVVALSFGVPLAIRLFKANPEDS